MGQSLCSQAIMSLHSGPPQIYHNSELSRGALPDFLNDFPFLVQNALLGWFGG